MDPYTPFLLVGFYSCPASVLENTSCPSGDIARVKTQYIIVRNGIMLTENPASHQVLFYLAPSLSTHSLFCYNSWTLVEGLIWVCLQYSSMYTLRSERWTADLWGNNLTSPSYLNSALWGNNRNSCFHKLSRPSKCVTFNVGYLLT